MKLKKLNSILGILLILALLGHAATMGYSLWTGWYNFPLCKMLARATAALAAAHGFLSILIMFTAHDGGNFRYKKLNRATLIQRISAVMILVFLHSHIKAYAHMATHAQLTTGQSIFFMVTELLFFAAVMSHTAVSVSKAAITLGLVDSPSKIKMIDKAAYILCAAIMAFIAGGMLSFFIGGLV